MRFLGFLVFIVIVFVALFFIGKSRLPDMVAQNLSKKLGVSVSIDSIDPGFSEVEVNQLVIGNPKGFSLPKAFSAEEIEVEAPIMNYFRDRVVIDEIEVKDIYLGLEFDSATSGDGNWSRIFANFQKNAGLDESGKKVFIKKIVFTNIQTDLLFKTDRGRVRRLPSIARIELNNISTEGGNAADQIMSSILGQMVRQVFLQQNLNNLIKGFLDPNEAVDTVMKKFKGLFNANRKKTEIIG